MEHVNHPDHYQLNGMEAIDIIAAVSKEYSGVAAFDIGNALKYIVRAKTQKWRGRHQESHLVFESSAEFKR